MRESVEHHNLVCKGARYISSRHADVLSVYIDDYSSLGQPKPLYYLQYEPDIIAEGSEFLIIGEAKTETDVLTAHSKRQYDSYLKYQDRNERDAYFYLFVPWKIQASAHNYLKNRCKSLGLNSAKWVVVSEIELIDF